METGARTGEDAVQAQWNLLPPRPGQDGGRLGGTGFQVALQVEPEGSVMSEERSFRNPVRGMDTEAVQAERRWCGGAQTKLKTRSLWCV